MTDLIPAEQLNTPAPDTLKLLLTRRSGSAKAMTGPGPSPEQLETILTAATRVPDHGKLEPWRLIVLEKPALMRLALLAEERGQALGLVADALAKGVAQFTDSNLAIAVVKCPRSTEKIAEIEQVLSVGAVCISLLNAALAAGWGANWLTGWAVEDQAFREVGLGLLPGEWVAGLIHVGTEGTVPPERPRPDLGSVVTWVNA